jgi:PLP dependent protein
MGEGITSREEFASRLDAVRERVERASRRAGRDPSSVGLMCVTKTRPLADVEVAASFGLRLFGENRVSEAELKFTSLLSANPDIRLHLIGLLQSNKAKRAVGLFGCVESVHSLGILEEIAKRASAEGRCVEVFLELHTGEESKSGFAGLDPLLRAAEASLSLESVRLRGLMTMAPFIKEAGPVRASFRELKRAACAVEARWPEIGSLELSMGMSNDFELAVEEGSTLIRIGTALFGERS